MLIKILKNSDNLIPAMAIVFFIGITIYNFTMSYNSLGNWFSLWLKLTLPFHAISLGICLVLIIEIVKGSTNDRP